jgi:hypothetical protein
MTLQPLLLFILFILYILVKLLLNLSLMPDHRCQ